jgi:hypothetical protein
MRKQGSRSVKIWFAKANYFLKKQLSTVGTSSNKSVVPMPYRKLGVTVINYARSQGY